MGKDYDSCACGNVARSDHNKAMLLQMTGKTPERYFVCEICQTTECFDVTPVQHMLAARYELSNDQRRYLHNEIASNQERMDAVEATFRLMGPEAAMTWMEGLFAELLPAYVAEVAVKPPAKQKSLPELRQERDMERAKHARKPVTFSDSDPRPGDSGGDAKRTRPAKKGARKPGRTTRQAR